MNYMNELKLAQFYKQYKHQCCHVSDNVVQNLKLRKLHDDRLIASNL